MRRLGGVRLLAVIVFVIAMPAAAFSEPRGWEPVDVPAGALCIECGMKVDPGSPFAAQIISGGKPVFFCDIGDMLHYYAGLPATEPPATEVYVKDYEYNVWIDGRSANYVKGGYFKSPMGWKIAAFRNGNDAMKAGTPMSFDEALEVVMAGEKPLKMKGKHSH